MIRIRCYKSQDDLPTSKRFLDGHRKVLEEFNLENISTNTPKWINHEGTYVIVAEYNGELIGGARLQIADNKLALPLEEAVAHYDSKILDLIKEKVNNGGACELCGLWNSRLLPPVLGITRLISTAAVSIANQINIRNIFAICAGYTLYPAMRMGMEVQKSVGNNGEFIYPNSNFRARVLCMDGISLKTSNEDFKSEILRVRDNPNFSTFINLENEPLQLNYSLHLKKGVIT
jgi:hypothetical protein